MPQLEVTTKGAEIVWQSPDKQRTIYKLELEYEGKPVSANTYSDAIATVGWTGTVETYEKPDKRGGSQTFVKQPPKEGGYSGGGGGGGRPYGTAGKHTADPFTMYLSYAKDVVVAHIAAQSADGKKMTLDDSIAATIQYGNMLYEARPDAQTTDKPAEAAIPYSDPAQGGEVDPVIEPTIEDLNKVLGGEILPKEETPWSPKN